MSTPHRSAAKSVRSPRSRLARAAWITLSGAAVVFVGCGDGRSSSSSRVVAPVDRAPADPTPPIEELTSVVVTIPPLRSLAESVVPEGVEVTPLVPPGRTVHGWEPGASDLVRLERASLVLAVGAGLESVGLERMLPVDRSWRMDMILGIEPGEAGHAHTHAGHEHCVHEGVDPHLWLDTALVVRWVRGVAEGLVASGVDAAAAEAAVASTVAEIEALDRYAAERLGPHRGEAIVTHHAAFGRFAERYGLVIAGVVLPAPGVQPSASELVALRRSVDEAGARAVFTERQFGGQAEDRLRGMLGTETASGEPLVFGALDPLGSGDYIAMMRANIDAIAEALEQVDGSG